MEVWHGFDKAEKFGDTVSFAVDCDDMILNILSDDDNDKFLNLLKKPGKWSLMKYEMIGYYSSC